ncbi:hypothetical protein ABS648_13460 [Pseudomonas solani]|uniref:Aspartate-semialdehyde dehydrogenase n=1 Tax=Pseudomonas solani TaxID=2731552 RepID=A0AAU7YAI1_9PSED
MNTPIEPVAPATAVDPTETRPERLPLPGEIHDPQIPVQPEVREPSRRPMQDDPQDIHLDSMPSDEDAVDEEGKS